MPSAEADGVQLLVVGGLVVVMVVLVEFNVDGLVVRCINLFITRQKGHILAFLLSLGKNFLLHFVPCWEKYVFKDCVSYCTSCPWSICYFQFATGYSAKAQAARITTMRAH